MLTIGERLKVRTDKDRGAALLAYRAAVASASAATEAEMSNKQLGDLADALTTRRLAPADFDADVVKYKTFLVRQTVLDETLSHADANKQINEMVARNVVINKEVEKLKAEANQNAALIHRLGILRPTLEAGMSEFKNDNPRLFGAI